jgi:hypothetical protein
MKTTQQEMVLEYLKNHCEGITSKQAFNLYGITRLSVLIFELRQKGNKISTADEKCKTRFGNTSVYGRYYLDE